MNKSSPPPSDAYDYDTHHVSIHSEDINSLQFPTTSKFEIKLPQEYKNVHSVRLSSWSFPSNYDTFSVFSSNTLLSFRFDTLYDAATNTPLNDLQVAIYDALLANGADPFFIQIEQGFYNPTQLMFELTNKMNRAVSFYIDAYFTANSITTTIPFTGYFEFIVAYDPVGQQMWFGNKCDQFTITNSISHALVNGSEVYCVKRNLLPNYSEYGLPSFIGLLRTDIQAQSPAFYLSQLPPNYYATQTKLTPEQLAYLPMVESLDFLNGHKVPRFFYGDVFAGDSGFWLYPDDSTKPNSQIYYFKCPEKINLMGHSYFYMEIDGLNCMDETKPFSIPNSALTKVAQCTSNMKCPSNYTNGINDPHNASTNSAFAKIPVCAAPVSRWIDRGAETMKIFSPPNATLKTLKVKFRYHDNSPVNFGTFNYSFTLEIITVKPKMR